MSMTGDAVIEMRAAFAEPRFIQSVPLGAIDGDGKPAAPQKPILMAPEGWQVIDPQPEKAAAIQIETLTGVADYLKHNVDGLELKSMMVHVAGPTVVRVVACLEGEDQKFRRQEFLRAVAQPAKFPFGQYMDVEDFVIGLQTCFVQDGQPADLHAFVASIRDNAVLDVVDDKVTQQVKTSRGVAFVENTAIRNPWLLAPFRTFLEVDQPESPFVLRARPGGQGSPKPQVGLFEADGGSWKIEATQLVASWLRTNETTKSLAIIA